MTQFSHSILVWFEIRSVWFYYMILSFMIFGYIKNEIFGSYFWDVSSWYQSLGLRDSDTLPGVSELKLREKLKDFQKENVFERSFEKHLERKEFF